MGKLFIPFFHQQLIFSPCINDLPSISLTLLQKKNNFCCFSTPKLIRMAKKSRFLVVCHYILPFTSSSSCSLLFSPLLLFNLMGFFLLLANWEWETSTTFLLVHSRHKNLYQIFFSLQTKKVRCFSLFRYCSSWLIAGT